eukprot:TRINITY_DN3950_c0_g1_i2.p2 TRINITY_DN3950_c0_g1~~TRINITY_DN3950_c0_g1_i2.p2  ORF type:complete len:199 (-),score=16.43 TRINITY_DN3950_c0_g1_i2:389-985(-)
MIYRDTDHGCTKPFVNINTSLMYISKHTDQTDFKVGVPSELKILYVHLQTVDDGTSPATVAGSFISAASSLNGQDFVRSYAQDASQANCEAAAQVLAEALVLEEGSSTAVVDAQAIAECLNVPLILLLSVVDLYKLVVTLLPGAACLISLQCFLVALVMQDLDHLYIRVSVTAVTLFQSNQQLLEVGAAVHTEYCTEF